MMKRQENNRTFKRYLGERKQTDVATSLHTASAQNFKRNMGGIYRRVFNIGKFSVGFSYFFALMYFIWVFNKY